MKCVNLADGQIIASDLQMKDSFFGRLVGLLNRSGLKDGEGIILNPCTQIHTFFMRFNIDVVFISKDFEVLAVIEDISPWRMSPLYLKARYTMELKGGYLAGRLKPGQKVSFEN